MKGTHKKPQGFKFQENEYSKVNTGVAWLSSVRVLCLFLRIITSEIPKEPPL